jgi:putative membrane protein
MKHIFTAACCILVAALPSLAQKKGAEKSAMTDQKFIDTAAQIDMVEANLGQLAGSNAASQEVKDYGQTLATDHTQDYQNLQNIAQQANLNVPTAIDAEHNKTMIAPFEKLNGAAFDKKYVEDMVSGHTKALELFKKEAQDAQSDAVKSYAQSVVPVLEKHLADAKDIEKTKKAAK